MRLIIEIVAATFLVLCIGTTSAAFAAGKLGLSLFEHDLFGKPVSTFPDHAAAPTA